jgi:hypothetical protein
MGFRIDLKYSILEEETLRYCEIYKITNIANQKVYIGKAVSHILNHKKYRPYGMEGRFRTHVSEAFSTKPNQCYYLNNAICKYGIANFILQLIRNCSIEDSDAIETEEIVKNNSLFPNGYNLNTGGKSALHTPESKKRVSNGVMNYFKESKLQRFQGVILDKDDIDYDKYMRPLNRENTQYGWYVYIQGKKADFGGTHISLEESKKMAIDFIIKIKELSVKYLDAGNPLEPSLPLFHGNTKEELG